MPQSCGSQPQPSELTAHSARPGLIAILIFIRLDDVNVGDLDLDAGGRLNEKLSDIDMSDWANVPPDELLFDPSVALRHPPLEAAARALRYARAAADAPYDEIGFRLRAAAPAWAIGPVPLETFATARLRHDREVRRRATDAAERARADQVMLRHRAIDLDIDGRFRFRVEHDLVHLTVDAEDGSEEEWTFAVSHPPGILRLQATAWDAQRLGAQQITADVPGMRWLPLLLLVEAGRFQRMQEWSDRLETGTTPGRYFAFVSHRWLTPEHPDPDGRQAQFVAWELVACTCEAIRVAQLRGLHEPRLQSAAGFTIGVQGSGLAESIIVNVLRQALDDQSLERAAAEVAAIGDLTRDHGVTAAAADAGLDKLRTVIDGHPALAALLARISVWYDYSCLPQPPRTDDDDTLFRQGLDALVACQVLGRTVVLLDDAEDYLTRAWCTLEGLVADRFTSIDTLVGSQRPTVTAGMVEDWFGKLLEDRPHIVWRGLLDTEVFGIQDAQACLARLSLAATDPDDLPFIYDRLRSLPAPRKVHIDDSEVVTGTMPLPALDGGYALAAGTSRTVGQTDPRPVASLDWTSALALDRVGLAGRRIIPSWSPRPSAAGQADAAHLAVVAGCEGEAILVTGWIDAHIAELETRLEISVVSMSWTASDIAPVGHLAEGTLELRAVQAALWVLVTTRVRLQRDSVASAIAAAVAASGGRLLRMVLDESQDNVELVPPPKEEPKARAPEEGLVALDPVAVGVLAGGLYKAVLNNFLSGRMNPDD